MRSLLLATTTLLFAGILSAGEKSKTPHAKIIVRPGPPVKPTQPAKPNNTQKSDWGDSLRGKK